MPRTSAFRGTWAPNQRPYLSLSADVWVSIQGETSVVACGECKRRLNLNKYLTGISTECAVSSPPGSATINLSIPDNDVNEFFADGQFLIISMMEIEIFAKGYYTVGGFPQYYRIFWGLITSVTKNWSNGVTSVSISCRDILRWWELTNVVTNPAFLDIGKSESNYNLFGNKFAGQNPYTVMIALAREAMGDFSITQSSFTSFRPEDKAERNVIAQYAKDIMSYWQLKFSNIWNSMVLYGSSGRAYTFSGKPGNVSPLAISQAIFEQEVKDLNLNVETALFKIQPSEIAAFKIDILSAGNVDFFQNEMQTKMQIALTCAQQAGSYEFYCDPNGSIIFKPPFFNLNTIPNKPTSWIYDFEIIDESIQETEQQVYTHVTSHGNAFGGVNDYGLNDDLTTPRTGVIDWHLLKRYGWRRLDLQLEWAGDPKKLFYHCLDHLDKVNSKRESGTITIPMRPELRLGFPVWIPSYDSFFYVEGISHQLSFGGQATTTLTLTAKRSKFIAPKNIGSISRTSSKIIEADPPKKEQKDPKKDPKKPKEDNQKKDVKVVYNYKIDFPSNLGYTSGLTEDKEKDYGGPALIRDPKTGKLLGFPNVVMVYRTSLSGIVLSRILEQTGSTKSKNPQKQQKQSPEGPEFKYEEMVREVYTLIQNEQRAELIDRLRLHRYEWGFNSSGAYDYAHDLNGDFKEFSVIPTDSVTWNPEKVSSNITTGATTSALDKTDLANKNNKKIQELEIQLKNLIEKRKQAKSQLDKTTKETEAYFKKRGLDQGYVIGQGLESSPGTGLVSVASGPTVAALNAKLSEADEAQNQLLAMAQTAYNEIDAEIIKLKAGISDLRTNTDSMKVIPELNIMVRPVSDEYGFEVIGHYRYGRGAQVTSGQVLIPTPEDRGKINQINIQFSPHGGLITNNPPFVNYGPESKDFAKAYEQMSPSDFVTGASFKGSNYTDEKQLDQVNFTGQDTFIQSYDRNARAGTSVFIEADSIRRAISLAELQPTLDRADGFGDVYPNCNCELGKTEWLSVLPQSIVQEILGPIGYTADSSTSETQVVKESGDPLSNFEAVNRAAEAALAGNSYDIGIETTSSGVGPSITRPTTSRVGLTGMATKIEAAKTLSDNSGYAYAYGNTFKQGNFFDKLADYLNHRFSMDYEQNLLREEFDTGLSRGIESPNMGMEQTNILTPEGVLGGGVSSDLFNRAAQGDPKALQELQKGVNFNFGRTEQSVKEANAKIADAGDKFKADIERLKKSTVFDPKTGFRDFLNLPTVETEGGEREDIWVEHHKKQRQIQPTPDETTIRKIPGGTTGETDTGGTVDLEFAEIRLVQPQPTTATTDLETRVEEKSQVPDANSIDYEPTPSNILPEPETRN